MAREGWGEGLARAQVRGEQRCTALRTTCRIDMCQSCVQRPVMELQIGLAPLQWNPKQACGCMQAGRRSLGMPNRPKEHTSGALATTVSLLFMSVSTVHTHVLFDGHEVR